nr:hypothetical protein BSM_16840 [uncultured archaeon]
MKKHEFYPGKVFKRSLEHRDQIQHSIRNWGFVII